MKPQQFVKIEDNIIDSVATIYERTEKNSSGRCTKIERLDANPTTSS
jgi:hypothetical protein